ncbi:hypothetical protein F441_02031 [Phytophthora nicotianae CJ01A1]|uniref:Uncharacterized protein n=5 Tax=Phytophthora nicotianae TaxID=4792 RepID=W2QNP0_PHYN3|nr:hypothetical protein PPTG_22263 [Phytophthora nicotianae INRA-310]ETI53308.1 hypothetical protein F443_03707 [Phytophthora nicotianae P1569]ETK93152.1 hypothetical protein L915_03599 [Phytophthora nicotianae]ETP25078.1 hypothetical protein F441_02031 [Phytophthora nicotianae CJ01A1]ETP51108.1 hypothetical protein F442_03682 [Phytophthora nicotianae P10297]ETL46569.1 hypothetical protein L916_03544 [Phytophthora nicotianae]
MVPVTDTDESQEEDNRSQHHDANIAAVAMTSKKQLFDTAASDAAGNTPTFRSIETADDRAEP